MTILIAEDEELMLKTLAYRMEKMGHEVHTAPDGQKAIELLEQIQVDLLITDIMMPFVTGLELISHIRINQQSNIPIIVLSVVGMENVVMEAFNLGADDFITKPFSPGELSCRVKRFSTKLVR